MIYQYRRLYLTSLIIQEKGELEIIDIGVIDAIKNNSILSENIQDEIEAKLSFGQNLLTGLPHLAEVGHLFSHFSHLSLFGF
ncbi:MAG: hypothetical protein LAT80_02340 [Balneolaceae bacterium]|nr:hypothetical protein [Balneolaceae bacterium]